MTNGEVEVAGIKPTNDYPSNLRPKDMPARVCIKIKISLAHEVGKGCKSKDSQIMSSDLVGVAIHDIKTYHNSMNGCHYEVYSGPGREDADPMHLYIIHSLYLHTANSRLSMFEIPHWCRRLPSEIKIKMADLRPPKTTSSSYRSCSRWPSCC
ncbi:uncharacterized protein BO96DRAFT_418484 [Aspergillus niger CBS 101883]|uniref:uncharacterized protein n=1 Tax=Aspergillus lacticoffeatus (strain CBS 101883) TaxID=1450533 RepID=UPI000D8019AB|nr:uncharacterized protein BO96DRAFT_418484 [Aspergillus niger CBS 101883]PYH63058.1 hypothetical protein BO96DRAFT_418484 [Aspergillus niger CBS 101883]